MDKKQSINTSGITDSVSSKDDLLNSNVTSSNSSYAGEIPDSNDLDMDLTFDRKYSKLKALIIDHLDQAVGIKSHFTALDLQYLSRHYNDEIMDTMTHELEKKHYRVITNKQDNLYEIRWNF